MVGAAGVALLVLRLLFAYSQQHVAMESAGFLSTRFEYLPGEYQLGLLLAGALLGVIGSGLAVGRFLKA